MVNPVHVLALVPVSILAGFLFSWLYVKRYIGEYAWLQGPGGLLNFMLWPRPPLNVVKLAHPDGRIELHYNVTVKEEKDNILFATSYGIVKAIGAQGKPASLTMIYMPGHPSPMHFVIAGLAGLVITFIVMYYSMVLLLKAGALSLIALVILVYAMMWYQAASTPSFTYYPLMLVSIASGYAVALPIPGEGASPRAVLERMNKGVIIRVDKDALDSLYEVAYMFGAVGEDGKPDISTAAELLATASMYTTIMKTATSATAKARRIAEVHKSIAVYLGEEIRRITIGKVIIGLLLIGLGFLIGYMMGGKIIIGPPPSGYPAPGYGYNLTAGVAGP